MWIVLLSVVSWCFRWLFGFALVCVYVSGVLRCCLVSLFVCVGLTGWLVLGCCTFVDCVWWLGCLFCWVLWFGVVLAASG